MEKKHNKQLNPPVRMAAAWLDFGVIGVGVEVFGRRHGLRFRVVPRRVSNYLYHRKKRQQH